MFKHSHANHRELCVCVVLVQCTSQNELRGLNERTQVHVKHVLNTHMRDAINILSFFFLHLFVRHSSRKDVRHSKKKYIKKFNAKDLHIHTYICKSCVAAAYNP